MKGKKKYLWALWLVILCALLMITGTYAAYISIRNAKSVTVAKTATTEIRFSSNYLYLRERTSPIPSMPSCGIPPGKRSPAML